jgi:double-stranded uracil-DNA glycosylase
MARFTRAELERYVDATVPDLVGDVPRLVVVGINPGLWTAATSTHFAHPSNRFYPALYLAGISANRIDPAAGMTTDDRDHLIGRGLAITNLVPRATARAADLSREELRRGARALIDRLAAWRPAVVAVAGVSAFRTAFGRSAGLGEQSERLAGARLFVVPNPSGLNAHETVASLARWYRTSAEAAGMVLDAPRWQDET